MLVAGVDGCAGKWMVAVGEAGCRTCNARLLLAEDFSDVLRRTAHCAAACVDMPIGLPEGDTPRRCDSLARQRHGSRRSQPRQPRVHCSPQTGGGIRR